jgi:hypothetical protein
MDTTLKSRLSKKTLLNIDGVDFLVINESAVAFMDGFKILPLKQSHRELLKKNFVNINQQAEHELSAPE